MASVLLKLYRLKRVDSLLPIRCSIFITFVTILLSINPGYSDALTPSETVTNETAWDKSILPYAVANWTSLLRDEIIKSSELMRHRVAKENFQNVKMVHVEGGVLLHQKANQVRELLRRRKEAVTRIRERAESASTTTFPDYKQYPLPYDAVKNINMEDSADPVLHNIHAPPVQSDPIEKWTHNISAQFPGWVNTTVSGVHVPSDVYDGSIPNLTGEFKEHSGPLTYVLYNSDYYDKCSFQKNAASEQVNALNIGNIETERSTNSNPIMQQGILYSKNIEPAFLKNFEEDKDTSYQFFAHIKGFMRMFPAVHMGTESDYYDARFRPWFSKAATSNKNIVILLDNSGSMTGQNMLIARHVINNILDTLSPDDFVNIILFKQNTANATIKCFENKLVPATFLNIVQLKRSLMNLKPLCPSNLELGLQTAFKLLNQTREKKIGALCNQAIMIVTDGPWMDTSIFKKHNEPFGFANKPVRVFTYQVGEFLRDAPGLKWIACQNQGWYLNVTLEEAARDRVATYIPVMARPWVLNNTHLIHWTHAYLHRIDTISLDLGWKKYERETQKKRSIKYRDCRRTPELLSFGNEDKPRFLQESIAKKEFNLSDLMSRSYLVVTVSTPVYNRSVNWSSNPYGELLGVAGIDVPIEEIRRVVPPHKAGVNNYFFMVTNNGFVVFHPDLRPTFFDTPKPTYASVDMTELEIELSSTSGKPGGIEQLRKQVVNRRNGTLVLMVEQPFDDMTRVETVRRRYYFTAIKETPYSLVFAVDDNIGPRDHTYRSRHDDGSSLAEFFKGYWRTNPSWYYCRDINTAVPVQDSDLLTTMKDWIREGNVVCDKELIDSLIEDASLTAWFPCYDQRNLIINRRFLEPFVTFIATKSGLTRWIDTDSMRPSVPFERHISVLHPRGPEEVWYRRAALHPDLTMVTAGPLLPTFSNDVNLEYEWQEINSDDMIITVSKAVVVESHKSHRSIPAVVGMQFKQNNLQAVFNDITGNKWCDKDSSCVPPCGSEHLKCYLLDADSIIIASSMENTIGSPFGKWHPEIMRGLIKDGIFRVVRIRDSQAICLRSSSRSLFSPTRTWMSTSVALTAMSFATRFLLTSNSYQRVGLLSIAAGASLGSLAFAIPTNSNGSASGVKKRRKFDLKTYLKDMRVPKSHPYSCTRQIDAMQLRLRQESGPLSGHSAYRRTECPDRPYSAAYVPETNLLFVSVLVNCTPTSILDDNLSSPILFNLSRIEINHNKYCKTAVDVDLFRHRTRFHSCLSNHSKEALNKTECGLDHLVPIDATPPEPPIFQFDYNLNCSKKEPVETNEEF